MTEKNTAIETEYSDSDPPFHEQILDKSVDGVTSFIKSQVKDNFSAILKPIVAMFESFFQENRLSIFATECAETLTPLGEVVYFEITPIGSEETKIEAWCLNPIFADYFESLWKSIIWQYPGKNILGQEEAELVDQIEEKPNSLRHKEKLVKAIEVPTRGQNLDNWKFVWEKVRSQRNKKTRVVLCKWFNGSNPDRSVEIDTFRKIIAAGDAGLLE